MHLVKSFTIDPRQIDNIVMTNEIMDELEKNYKVYAKSHMNFYVYVNEWKRQLKAQIKEEQSALQGA